MAFWNDERIEALKKLWADGLSASQIQRELGAATRNMIIGKVHRLGLSGRQSPLGRAPRARAVLVRAARTLADNGKDSSLTQRIKHRLAPPPPALVVVPAAPEPAPPDPVPPAGQRCSVMELTADACRWPIGDPQSPEFSFCGDMAIDGRPYCARHFRMAYVPRSQLNITDAERERRREWGRQMQAARRAKALSDAEDAA
jgi:GcrA cell cycle regulator